MTAPQLQEDRPAYVSFEKRAVEDRAASIEKGHYVAKDVDFVIVTPAGSKDRIERNAKEWLANMRDQVRQERLPQKFLAYYESAYKAWQEQEEIPLHGTPLMHCTLFSPAQLAAIKQANIKTVEDLAAANEEMVMRLGMGGRSLKQQAQSWLDSSQDSGKVAARLAALETENKDLKEQNESLATSVKQLLAKLESLQPAPPAGKPL